MIAGPWPWCDLPTHEVESRKGGIDDEEEGENGG